MPDYIRWLRGFVGHQQILMNCGGCVVADEHGRVLLQKRGDRGREVWGFPGGAVEMGESVAEAAVRETYEETGLRVRVTSLLGVYSAYPDEYPNGDKVQSISVFFRCAIEGGQLTVDGHETLALAYFHLDDLPELVNQQHRDVAEDFRTGRTAVWR